MQKKIVILNIILLIFIALILIYILASMISGIFSHEECRELFSLINLKYDSCYNEATGSIILILNRGADSYNLNSITIAYTDITLKKSLISDIPKSNEIKDYSFNSSKNPVRIRIIPELSIPVSNLCSTEKIILIPDCSETPSISASLILLEGGNISKNNTQISDLISPKLVKEEQLWSSGCNSEWQCGSWEECTDGIQKRECKDKHGCQIPINPPDFTKNCNETCHEDWRCQWPPCENSYTTPVCQDMNNCGTYYLKPSALACENNGCTPNPVCENWEPCKITLELDKLTENFQEIYGQRARLCHDLNNCLAPKYEVQSCSIKVDIYTKKVEWQGEEYLEIYDKISNKLLSRLKYSENNLNLNFYLN